MVRKRHLSFRHPLTEPMLRVQSAACFAMGKFLRDRGFVELRAPILSTCTDPGIRGALAATTRFYGKEYKLMTSMILHKQMALTAIKKIFSFSPNVRLEPPDAAETGRHLAEFTQLDVEAARFSRAEIMRLAEEMIAGAVKTVKEECEAELSVLGRDLRVPKPPFRKLPHSKAVEILKSEGFGVSADKEIPWEAEKVLSESIRDFFWVIDYPKGSRGFYDRVSDNDSKVLVDFDLMYPEGFGEAISGSEREHRPAGAREGMLRAGVNPKEYGWYFEMLRSGIPPSAGFGLGIERFTRYLCGLEKVWQAAAFPKVPGVHSP